VRVRRVETRAAGHHRPQLGHGAGPPRGRRRAAGEAGPADGAARHNAGETGTRQPPIPGQQAGRGTVAPRPRPRRFYAKVTLDPNRPTPQVSNIAQSILSELDRVRGTTITLTLDIDAEAADGFPDDVTKGWLTRPRSARLTPLARP
jgi:hypothetical protein